MIILLPLASLMLPLSNTAEHSVTTEPSFPISLTIECLRLLVLIKFHTHVFIVIVVLVHDFLLLHSREVHLHPESVFLHIGIKFADFSPNLLQEIFNLLCAVAVSF